MRYFSQFPVSHFSQYGTKCAGCSEPVQSSEWVRRARDFVFHLECFKCSACKRKLSTGDTCVLRGETMLCSEHGEVHGILDEPDNVSGTWNYRLTVQEYSLLKVLEFNKRCPKDMMLPPGDDDNMERRTIGH